MSDDKAPDPSAAGESGGARAGANETRGGSSEARGGPGATQNAIGTPAADPATALDADASAEPAFQLLKTTNATIQADPGAALSPSAMAPGNVAAGAGGAAGVGDAAGDAAVAAVAAGVAGVAAVAAVAPVVAGGEAGEGAVPLAAVRLTAVVKQYGAVTAVDGVDLSVRRGEFFGLLGPNGAGKSTIIKMITGLIRPTRGVVAVLGKDVVEDPLGVKAQIGLVPEDMNLYERLTGEEYLHFAGRMYGLAEGDVKDRAAELLDLLEMAPSRNQLIVDYSMGMRKKIALAAALIHNPRVLLLDEPFNGVDVVGTRSIRAILTRLVARGVTVFFSSHVLDMVERLCTRVAVLKQGRLVAVGTLPELRSQLGVDALMTLEDMFLRTIGEEGQERSLSWIA